MEDSDTAQHAPAALPRVRKAPSGIEDRVKELRFVAITGAEQVTARQ